MKTQYFALMPRAVESLDLSAYELVISSSHAVAKGARTRPGQIHVCLCYSPARYAWDLEPQYLAQTGLDRGMLGALARAQLARFRRWDLAVSSRVDRFVAISEYIARRIKQCYGRDADVVYPPVDPPGTAGDESSFAAEEDFGIAPLEAQACGTPVIAYGRGGSAETIRGLDGPEPTGVLFAEQSAAAIGAAVAQFEAAADRISAAACRANAARFSRPAFERRFADIVADAQARHSGRPR